MYLISKGKIVNASSVFCRSYNCFEIILNKGSIVESCFDVDIQNIPAVRFNFTKIRSLGLLKEGDRIGKFVLFFNVVDWIYFCFYYVGR